MHSRYTGCPALALVPAPAPPPQLSDVGDSPRSTARSGRTRDRRLGRIWPPGARGTGTSLSSAAFFGRIGGPFQLREPSLNVFQLDRLGRVIKYRLGGTHLGGRRGSHERCSNWARRTCSTPSSEHLVFGESAGGAVLHLVVPPPEMPYTLINVVTNCSELPSWIYPKRVRRLLPTALPEEYFQPCLQFSISFDAIQLKAHNRHDLVGR